MIFIKDKKAWKDLVKQNSYVCESQPHKYPCYGYDYMCNSTTEEYAIDYLYADELRAMADRLDSGREF